MYKSEVRVNGPKSSVWGPSQTTYHGSSAQWAPAPPVTYSGGGLGFGGPMGADDQDVIWDEARGGYWIKETIMDAGYSTSMSGGGGASGYSPISSVPVGHTEAYGFNGCRGCTTGPTKSTCGGSCQSMVAMAPRRSCGCQAPLVTLPQAPPPTTIISLPHKSCNCSSGKSSTAYPLVQSMYRSGNSSCGGGSAISCGCHARPSCGCGAYH